MDNVETKTLVEYLMSFDSEERTQVTNECIDNLVRLEVLEHSLMLIIELDKLIED